MKLFPVALCLVCMATGVTAQRWYVSRNQPDERVIGLLDLPDVTRNYADDACESSNVTVPLAAEPSTAGRSVGVVSLRNHPEYGCSLLFKRTGTSTEEQLPSEESDYEIAAAVVYERRGRWFRIAVPEGSAWIERTNADGFYPYPQLLLQRLAYLRNDWDGQLRQTAGFGSPTAPLPLEWKERIPRQIGVEVLAVQRISSEDWIHVRFAIERCGDDTLGELKPVEGWLQAYRSDGIPAAWFYSRGC
jgi:hypothetical protein